MRLGVRLGVDVGSVRVGLAVSDAEGILATPVDTLTRDPVSNNDIKRVAHEFVEREAVEVIVGLPRSLDGHEGSAAQVARSWANGLRVLNPAIPVRLVDERFTTAQAHQAMREANVSTRRSRSFIDQQAAVMILQGALDEERTTGRPAGSLLGARKARHRSRAKGLAE